MIALKLLAHIKALDNSSEFVRCSKMSHNNDNIVIEILRDLQGGQAHLRSGQQQTNERLAAIEHHMAGFHGSLVRFDTVVEELEHRVARIERRLQLSDPDPSSD